MKRRIKFKYQNIFLLLFFLFFLFLFVFSGIHIYHWFLSNQKNSHIQKEVEEFIEIHEENEASKVKYEIDFSSLKEQNQDTVGYLRLLDPNISYVVVRGVDNSYYLNHNFYREWNVSGWVFVDYRNVLDGRDRNTIIYAHNTYDGSMFGSLKRVLDDDWYQQIENHFFDFILEGRVLTYQVFSVYTVKSEDYYIQTDFSSDDVYLEFLNTIRGRSKYLFDVYLDHDSKILTLSTCTIDGKSRVVLHAKLLYEEAIS